MPRLASRGASAAIQVARGGVRVAAMAAGTGARVTAKAAGTGARVTAKAAGTGVRATGVAASTGVHAAAVVLGAGAGAAGIAAKVAAPRRLLPRGHRGTRSEVHLSSAAEGASLEGNTEDEGHVSRSSSDLFGGHLLRTQSSPDASLMPGGSAALHREGSASSGGSSPRGPSRSLLRQSTAMASTVLSRLSRASTPWVAHYPGQRSERAVTDPAADAAPAGPQGQLAGGQGVASPGSGGDAASAEQQRLQRERRLHEQALAELVVLAGPLGTTRPPELPSAAATAEAAAARLAEQQAFYKHIQRVSAPDSKPAKAAGSGGALSSDGGTVGNAASPFSGRGSGFGALGRHAGRSAASGAASRVLRTSTAPPAVSSLLHEIAAEEMERLEEVLEDGGEAGSEGGLLEQVASMPACCTPHVASKMAACLPASLCAAGVLVCLLLSAHPTLPCRHLIHRHSKRNTCWRAAHKRLRASASRCTAHAGHPPASNSIWGVLQ